MSGTDGPLPTIDVAASLDDAFCRLSTRAPASPAVRAGRASPSGMPKRPLP